MLQHFVFWSWWNNSRRWLVYLYEAPVNWVGHIRCLAGSLLFAISTNRVLHIVIEDLALLLKYLQVFNSQRWVSVMPTLIHHRCLLFPVVVHEAWHRSDTSLLLSWILTDYSSVLASLKDRRWYESIQGLSIRLAMQYGRLGNVFLFDGDVCINVLIWIW